MAEEVEMEVAVEIEWAVAVAGTETTEVVVTADSEVEETEVAETTTGRNLDVLPNVKADSVVEVVVEGVKRLTTTGEESLHLEVVEVHLEEEEVIEEDL